MGKFDGILILSDFDRTLTGPDGTVCQKNLDAIQYFEDNGGLFSIDTGRSLPLFRCKAPMCHINAPVVLNNGALCYDLEKEQVIFSVELDPDIWDFMDELQKRFPMFNCEVQGLYKHAVYRAEQARLEQFKDHGVEMYEKPFREITDPFYMVACLGHFINPEDTSISFRSIETENEKAFIECNQWIEESSHYSPVRSTHEILEFMIKGISKGSGARRLASTLNVEKLICVGDALNDVSMVREADIGYMPCDGDSVFFPLAGPDMILCASSEDGAVADIIDRL